MPKLNVTEWHYLWLKTVAEAWKDWDSGTGFRAKLVANPRSTISTRFGPYNAPNMNPDPKKSEKQWPLPEWIALNVLDPTDAAVVRNKAFGWTPQWMPRAGFWSLPNTEVDLLMPRAPGDITAALADLAEKMATLVTINPITVAPTAKATPTQQGGAKGGRATQGGGVETQGAGSRESPSIAFEQMVRWFTVWPLAAAHVWTDPNGAFTEHLFKSPNLALYNAFGFEVPAGTKLTVADSGTTYDPNNPSPPTVTLTMYIPPPPAAKGAAFDVKDGPVALATYAESGRSFPFTLCTVVC